MRRCLKRDEFLAELAFDRITLDAFDSFSKQLIAAETLLPDLVARLEKTNTTITAEQRKIQTIRDYVQDVAVRKLQFSTRETLRLRKWKNVWSPFQEDVRLSAALEIQATWRMFLAKKEKRILQKLHHDKVKTAAASKLASAVLIQRIYRGFRDRVYLKRTKMRNSLTDRVRALVDQFIVSGNFWGFVLEIDADYRRFAHKLAEEERDATTFTTKVLQQRKIEEDLMMQEWFTASALQNPLIKGVDRVTKTYKGATDITPCGNPTDGSLSQAILQSSVAEDLVALSPNKRKEEVFPVDLPPTIIRHALAKGFGLNDVVAVIVIEQIRAQSIHISKRNVIREVRVGADFERFFKIRQAELALARDNASIISQPGPIQVSANPKLKPESPAEDTLRQVRGRLEHDVLDLPLRDLSVSVSDLLFQAAFLADTNEEDSNRTTYEEFLRSLVSLQAAGDTEAMKQLIKHRTEQAALIADGHSEICRLFAVTSVSDLLVRQPHLHFPNLQSSSINWFFFPKQKDNLVEVLLTDQALQQKVSELLEPFASTIPKRVEHPPMTQRSVLKKSTKTPNLSPQTKHEKAVIGPVGVDFLSTGLTRTVTASSQAQLPKS
ncbi:hypothetical protein BBJ28_00005211 [Nothophytophthora sp. Chile5]|nr:hypothetical protein BBJ28_00005211 [Nothophytophthora sp. Chile5]